MIDHAACLGCCSDMKSVAKSILKLQNGVCLFVGKMIDVSRVRIRSPLQLARDAYAV